MNTFVQQGHVKLIKRDSKDIYVTKDFYFKQMLFLWTCIKESGEKNISLFPQKNIKPYKIVFKIDNAKKCFLSTKSAD